MSVHCVTIVECGFRSNRLPTKEGSETLLFSLVLLIFEAAVSNNYIHCKTTTYQTNKCLQQQEESVPLWNNIPRRALLPGSLSRSLSLRFVFWKTPLQCFTAWGRAPHASDAAATISNSAMRCNRLDTFNQQNTIFQSGVKRANVHTKISWSISTIQLVGSYSQIRSMPVQNP